VFQDFSEELGLTVFGVAALAMICVLAVNSRGCEQSKQLRQRESCEAVMREGDQNLKTAAVLSGVCNVR
jgi:hypothetical protein